MSGHLRKKSSAFQSCDLRLFLLGNIGCGKTASANTILDQLAPTSLGAAKGWKRRESFTEGRSVTLVEAPRWYWSGEKVDDGVRKETEEAMALLEPGPHAVLLLVPVNQFTEVDCRVPTELKELFGEKVLDHCLVLLTCGDYLLGGSLEDYLQKEHLGLRQMINTCGGRVHLLNNRRPKAREQVRELLDKVDDMVQKNGIYTKETADERDPERTMGMEKQEFVETFRTQAQEKSETLPSNHISDMTTLDKEKEPAVKRESKSGEEDESEVEWRGGEVQVSSGLYGAPGPEQISEAQPRRAPPTPEATPTPPPLTLLSCSDPHPSSEFACSSSQNSTSFSSLPSECPPELRLVLLGRSGAGKSSAGNSILGQEAFRSEPDSLTSMTKECEKRKGLVEGRRVAVVDTPDWFNSEQSPEEVLAQISSCVALSSPGPHAFLICVPLDRPAKVELQALEALQVVFGPDSVTKHTIVLFTYEDRLKKSGKMASGSSVEAHIAKNRQDLLEVVEKCRDRFHILQKGGRERESVADLLDKVERTLREAEVEYYSSDAFQEAESRVRQRQMDIARERRGEESGQEAEKSKRPFSPTAKHLHPHMQTLFEEEEDLDKMEKIRDEAERSVGMLENVPTVPFYSFSPSLLSSIREKVQSGVKQLPKLLENGSEQDGEGIKGSQSSSSSSRSRSSMMWRKLSDSALKAQRSLRGQVEATAEHVSKAFGQRVPKVVSDGSAWVGSGAKAVAGSPVWEKLGAGTITGAKLVANGSVKVGVGIGAGAQRVAQSPVWGKVGSGAKGGVKMMRESSVWEKVGTAAKQVPVVVVAAALLGLLLGVFLYGATGGVVGAAAGSAATEVGRRKFRSKRSTEQTGGAVTKEEQTQSCRGGAGGEKSLKVE